MIPDLSFLWVIFLVLLITTLLNLLLFKPLIAVMRRRDGAVTSARTLAESAAARAQQAADELESRTKAARADVYQQMDASRRAAEDSRAQLLAAAREQVAASTSAATAQIATETAEARVRIERDAEGTGQRHCLARAWPADNVRSESSAMPVPFAGLKPCRHNTASAGRQRRLHNCGFVLLALLLSIPCLAAQDHAAQPAPAASAGDHAPRRPRMLMRLPRRTTKVSGRRWASSSTSQSSSAPSSTLAASRWPTTSPRGARRCAQT